MGKELNFFFQSIVDAYETDVPQNSKEVHTTFVKNKDQKD